MAGTEAERRAARVQVVEKVANIGDGEMALVLRAVRVRVADKGSLPVVMDEVVGKGDVVAGMGDIEKAVIVVL
jgi:hypothetical protein